MYVDSNEIDKAKKFRREWLWQEQFQQQARVKMFLCFLFGFGVGFVSSSVVIAWIAQ
jgi:hypothetical protein